MQSRMAMESPHVYCGGAATFDEAVQTSTKELEVAARNSPDTDRNGTSLTKQFINPGLTLWNLWMLHVIKD